MVSGYCRKITFQIILFKNGITDFINMSQAAITISMMPSLNPSAGDFVFRCSALKPHGYCILQHISMNASFQ